MPCWNGQRQVHQDSSRGTPYKCARHSVRFDNRKTRVVDQRLADQAARRPILAWRSDRLGRKRGAITGFCLPTSNFGKKPVDSREFSSTQFAAFGENNATQCELSGLPADLVDAI